jgi:predicted GTPase
MLTSKRKVIAVSAVRTGCGKSKIARWLSTRLRERGLTAATLRHPMPYGDLEKQAVQRFADRADLDAADCTIEEREEYEPHIAAGNIVYAGVDYAAILAAAEQEAAIILWDGGNNDFPFIRPDLHIVVVDALRPDQLTTHHPGEAVLRMADAVVINKVNSAPPEDVERVARGVRAILPSVPIVRAASPVRLSDPDMVKGRRVLVVEDGPTITHGGMPYGAGYVAARAAGAAEIVDPRPFAVSMIRDAFARFPHIGPVLPALGYGAAETAALRETIARADAETVVAATPIDLAALIRIEKPVVRARYEFAESGGPGLSEIIDDFLSQR